MSAVKTDNKEIPESLGKIYDSLIRQIAKEKDKTQAILTFDRECIKALDPPKFPPLPKQRVKGDEETALLLLSDIHVHELISLAETMGTNEYDPDIMITRVHKIAPSVIRLIELERKSKPVHNLVILLLGDIVTGENIYKGQPFYVNASALHQARFGATVLAELINSLSPHFKSICVETTPGNHGRVSPIGMSHYQSNWDDVLYDQMEQQLKNNKRITFIRHQEVVCYTEIMGKKIAFSHGHCLGNSSNMDTLMSRAATDWPRLLQKDVDICVFGHWHTPVFKKVGMIDVFMNGSVCGPNLFSVSKIRQNTPPYQWLLGIHPARVSWQYLIDFKK
jgi:hypothetical protein